jgi:hypothetical protein
MAISGDKGGVAADYNTGGGDVASFCESAPRGAQKVLGTRGLYSGSLAVSTFIFA